MNSFLNCFDEKGIRIWLSDNTAFNMGIPIMSSPSASLKGNSICTVQILDSYKTWYIQIVAL